MKFLEVIHLSLDFTRWFGIRVPPTTFATGSTFLLDVIVHVPRKMHFMAFEVGKKGSSGLNHCQVEGRLT